MPVSKKTTRRKTKRKTKSKRKTKTSRMGDSAKPSKKFMLDQAANEMVQMKERGISGNYTYGLYPSRAPNLAINSIASSKYGRRRKSTFGSGNPYLNDIGITGNYQYAFYPYPAPNSRLNANVASSFGRTKRKTKRKTKTSRTKRKTKTTRTKKKN